MTLFFRLISQVVAFSLASIPTLSAADLISISKSLGEPVRLEPSAGRGFYGRAVSIEDGYALVSAEVATQNGIRGPVYVYRHNPSSGTWSEIQILSPTDQEADLFGNAIAQAGNYVVIGANASDIVADNGGAAFIFRRQSNGTWVEVEKLIGVDVGRDSGFGTDVDILNDGTVFIGNPNLINDNDDPGSVYVFERLPNQDNWEFTQKLTPQNSSPSDRFGLGISATSAGLAVGSSLSTTTFTRNSGGIWIQNDSIPIASFNVAISNEFLAIGDENSGQKGMVHTYTYSSQSNSWNPASSLSASDGFIGDGFGSAVSIFGNRMLVGAYAPVSDDQRAGAVYLFSWSGGAWVETTRFEPQPAQEDDLFGISVSLSAEYAIAGSWALADQYAYAFFLGSSSPGKVVSLGDSYSSGEGAGGYDPATNKFDSRLANYNRCHRSRWAWNGLEPGGDFEAYAFREMYPGGLDHSLVACSGAVADDVDTSRQTDSEGRTYAAPDNVPQIERNEANGADIVTLTIGGNDALFGDVITECFLWNCLNSDELAQASVNIDSLYARLRDTYASVKNASPGAPLLVHGYPRLFSSDYAPGSALCNIANPLFQALRISPAEARELNALADKLNGVIGCAAQSAGVHFVDTVPMEFEGHGVCSLGLDYIRRPRTVTDLLIPWIKVEMYHPNWRGQQAYASALFNWLEQNSVVGEVPPNPAPDDDLVFCDAVSSTAKGSATSSSESIIFLDDSGTESFVFEHEDVVSGAATGFNPGASVSVSVRRASGGSISFGTLGSAQVGADGVLRLDFTAEPQLGEGFVQIRAEQSQGGSGAVAYASFLTGPSDYLDSDNDGLLLGEDWCPDVASTQNRDSDGDFIGDACDICPNDDRNDDDGDGICSSVDQCPLDPDDDLDNDGVCGNVDNCPQVSNVNQRDSDGDGAGDACDSLSSGFSGAWFDPQYDGEGWLVEILSDNAALVYWFTYPSSELPSSDSQFWMVGVGQIVGNRIVLTDVRAPYGARFGSGFNPSDVDPAPWGSLILEFDGCNSGTALYSGPNGFGSGAYSITRITSIAGLNCTPPSSVKSSGVGSGSAVGLPEWMSVTKGSAADGFQVSGAWFDPTHDGEGWLLEYLDDGRVLIYWFTYDRQGDPMWMVGVGNFVSDTEIEVDFYRPEGTFFGPVFDPDDITAALWGNGLFSFSSCMGGSMVYDGRNSGFGQGSFSISRLTTVLGAPCSFPSGGGGGGNPGGSIPIANLIGPLRANDGNEFDAFGYSVDIDGNLSVVGARSADGGGAAYIFERVSGNQWVQRSKLTPGDGSTSFGTSVSVSEGRVVVGAPSAAKAFFYGGSGTSWNLTDTVSGTSGSEFGFSVNINGDEAIVGAPRSGSSGAARVYWRQGNSWQQEDELTGSQATSSARFGSSVSISNGRALVGAPEDQAVDDDTGAAFVYRRTGGGSWVQDQRLLPSDATDDMEFGFSVSLDGERALVGAWRASPNGSESGAAYVFEIQSGNNWTQRSKITPSDAEAGDWFGHSVSLYSSWALIGADGMDDIDQLAGGAYLYALVDGGWEFVDKLLPDGVQRADTAGFSSALGEIGLLIGSWGDDANGVTAGAAYVYSVQDGS